MTKGRLEAFSDAVIAIIITIMVLELRPPHGDSVAVLAPLVPVFLSYVLSFTLIGIYWNPRDLEPGATRRLGFAFGRGQSGQGRRAETGGGAGANEAASADRGLAGVVAHGVHSVCECTSANARYLSRSGRATQQLGDRQPCDAEVPVRRLPPADHEVHVSDLPDRRRERDRRAVAVSVE